MEIYFSRDDCTVKCSVDTETDACKPVIPFQWHAHTQVEAEILRRWLDDALREMMARVRQSNYEAGWDDKRKKVRKRNTGMFQKCGLVRGE